MKTTYSFIVVLLSLALSVRAQETTSKTSDVDFGISLGYVHQNYNFVTIGGVVGKNIGYIHAPGGWSYGLATEFNVNNGTSIIGAKAFFDVHLILIGLRLNTISYFKGSTTDFRLTPEIGINLLGLCNFYYGYNIPAAGTEMQEISRNRLNFTFNLYPKLKASGKD